MFLVTYAIINENAHCQMCTGPARCRGAGMQGMDAIVRLELIIIERLNEWLYHATRSYIAHTLHTHTSGWPCACLAVSMLNIIILYAYKQNSFIFPHFWHLCPVNLSLRLLTPGSKDLVIFVWTTITTTATITTKLITLPLAHLHEVVKFYISIGFTYMYSQDISTYYSKEEPWTSSLSIFPPSNLYARHVAMHSSMQRTSQKQERVATLPKACCL